MTPVGRPRGALEHEVLGGLAARRAVMAGAAGLWPAVRVVGLIATVALQRSGAKSPSAA